ncbi:bifunctional DNA primase/polymerase [Mycobacterium ostraviense]|uniref:bifunctional DNA primase/polymerase n=1 Tax=Mycobacterium ostraviense TaxID=2738409 RepID=UPI0009E31887
MILPNGNDPRKRLHHNESGGINSNSAVELPDVTGLSNAAAAQMYAKAGLHVVPIKPGTKHPGSYLGRGWPARASADLEVVSDWWRRSDQPLRDRPGLPQNGLENHRFPVKTPKNVAGRPLLKHHVKQRDWRRLYAQRRRVLGRLVARS